jgi:hypothetical protein
MKRVIDGGSCTVCWQSGSCTVCWQIEHRGGCFRCGKRIEQINPFSRVLTAALDVRQVAKPRKANTSGKRVVLYDHEGADRYDAQAIVTVGYLRHAMRKAHVKWVGQKYADGSLSWKTWMRIEIERALEVRPIIDKPDKLEAEVARLLRAKAALAELAKMGDGGASEGFVSLQVGGGRFNFMVHK